jgi:hypothetical protein
VLDFEFDFPHDDLAALLAEALATCDAAVTDSSDSTRALAAQMLAGDPDAGPVLADHLTDHAHPSIVNALRRRESWAAEIVAGVPPWSSG